VQSRAQVPQQLTLQPTALHGWRPAQANQQAVNAARHAARASAASWSACALQKAAGHLQRAAASNVSHVACARSANPTASLAAGRKTGECCLVLLSCCCCCCITFPHVSWLCSICIPGNAAELPKQKALLVLQLHDEIQYPSTHNLSLACLPLSHAAVTCTGLPSAPATANSNAFPGTCAGQAFGNVCSAQCADGFSGNLSSTCTASGEWSQVAGSCEQGALAQQQAHVLNACCSSCLALHMLHGARNATQ
jgi:hypothetical protein